ncbi:hypothetical protein SynSYN20_01625 [Synechococcus sp. SYN20]|nr:hypothetical protein SynSYN20_01625 [Synechococcus sp. SYN20]
MRPVLLDDLTGFWVSPSLAELPDTLHGSEEGGDVLGSVGISGEFGHGLLGQGFAGVDELDLVAIEADVQFQVVGLGSGLQRLSDLNPGPLHRVLGPLVVGLARAVLQKAELIDKLLGTWREHPGEAVALLG